MTKNADVPKLVFTCDYDERAECEAELKRWFEAAVARFPSGLEVPLAFRDPVRLAQDLESEQAQGRCCIGEVGLVVVPRVTRAYMEASLIQLHREGYFGRLAEIGGHW